MSKLPVVSDEDLMAYADGELGDAKARVIGRAIDNDPELAARLKVFRVTGRALAPHFDTIDLGETPAAMLDAIHSTAVRAGPARPSLLARVQGFLDQLGLGPSPWPALAGIAAGIVIGAAATQLGGYRSADASWIAMQADGRVVAAGALAQVLERAPSSASGSSTIVATSSFQALDDRYCRLYEALSQAGLACRNPTGDWQVVAMGEGTAGAGENKYGPSGGSGSSAVNDLANLVMKSEAALDPASEAALIARKWEAR